MVIPFLITIPPGDTINLIDLKVLFQGKPKAFLFLLFYHCLSISIPGYTTAKIMSECTTKKGKYLGKMIRINYNLKRRMGGKSVAKFQRPRR